MPASSYYDTSQITVGVTCDVCGIGMDKTFISGASAYPPDTMSNHTDIKVNVYGGYDKREI